MMIGAFSERTGVSADTLRYYEKIGLIPMPARDSGGNRVFSDDHLRWMEFLEVLKSTGMGVKAMSRYVMLRSQGTASIPERLSILKKHYERVSIERQRLADAEQLLADKIVRFQAVVDGQMDPADLTCAQGRRK